MADADLVIIGGGAGGLTAAREARRRGARVTIVQDGPIGGDCTFTGCVPSKALLAEAARGAPFDAAMTVVHDTIDRIAATENADALAHEGIAVVPGFARFTSRRTVDVDGTTIRAQRFIIATGATPLVPPIPGLADVAPLTNETLFSLDHLPRSLVVLGGGPIGCEMAQAFARLGTTVTIVELADRLLPREEPAASEVITAALQDDGVIVCTGRPATKVTRRPDGDATVTLASPDDGSVDDVTGAAVLVALGRVPSGRGLGLEELGVEIDRRGAVAVDDAMATTVAGIWAIGDVVGRAQFTHAAGRMGWVAATNALSRTARARPAKFDDRVLPWATFTSPEVGRVGLTEAEAAVENPGSRVVHLPLELVDRAVITGETAGFIKLVAAPRRVTKHLGGGRLVGATVVAPCGGELVHEAAVLMQSNAFAGRMAQTIHAYPTWSMGMQLAALKLLDRDPGPGPKVRPAEAP